MEHFLSHWGYLALFAFNFTSALGIPVGSEPAMGYAGALASGELTAHGDPHLQLGIVILVAIAGDTAGSVAGYSIGRFGGRPLIDRLGRFILLTHRDLDRAEAWFERRGDPFVFVGRLIPLLRSFVSLAAGIGEMAFGTFLAFTLLGVAIYDAAICSIGYALGSGWDHVIKAFSDAGYVVAALVVLGVVGVILHRVSVIRAENSGRAPSGQRGRHAPGAAGGERADGNVGSGFQPVGSATADALTDVTREPLRPHEHSHVKVRPPVRPETEPAD
ncbi:MAG: DedA family protein [Actinomycetota bacterium]|nr:DedA family protein [Actinomycetota bacterium]